MCQLCWTHWTIQHEVSRNQDQYYNRGQLMLSISEIAARIAAADADHLVEGLNNFEMKQLCESWQTNELPSVYLEFLHLMGRSAGRILLGTDAFFPRILEMPRASSEFFADNVEGMQLPEGALVFAIHQGYQVYWMESTNVPDP